ncbi:hypothetical protein HGRIS_012309 [Hohenbuehelia grisea]|uniref:DDE Tnp4 domain-containing protein n=1 Tax=Hohenbuehelia grisea TaxID=104357 RepID=A0ABR3IRY1_9AGAR
MDPALQALFLWDDDGEELLQAQALCALTLLVGVLEAHEQSVRRRNPSRLYLCRPQLLPNPRIGTPWQQLHASQSDRAFITTMGFDIETFNYLLYGPNRFAERWNTTPIPRVDTSSAGNPRLGRRSLDAAGGLGLVLHYLGSAMLEISLQQIFALVPSTVSRYLDFAKAILLKTVRSMDEGRIGLPKDEEEYEENSQLITVRHPLLEGAFGGIDGLSLLTQISEDPEIENATYNGWKSDHRTNNVLAFSPKGTIIAAVLNAPGSWHDSHVAQPIYNKLRTNVPDGYFLMADSAFPRGPKSIKGKIRAPLKDGALLPGNQ